MSSSPAIIVESISKRFDDVEALIEVSLVAETGKVLGLLGPNGAGKTTLVRILTTLIVPDAGSASVLGLDVVSDARPLRGRIGLAGQFAAVDELLTGRENLELVGRLARRHQDRTGGGVAVERTLGPAQHLDTLDVEELEELARRRLHVDAVLVDGDGASGGDREPTGGGEPSESRTGAAAGAGAKCR